ncbi:site-specific integrase [Leptospira interrogans]
MPQIAHLIRSYKASRLFLDLRPVSRSNYTGVLNKLEHALGPTTNLQAITRSSIERMLAAQSPGAVANALKKWRILARFAISHGWLTVDPSFGIKRPKPTDGHHCWTDAELTHFRLYWPIGTRQRTAFELVIQTGQRVSDVYRMTHADVSGDLLYVRQSKTGRTLHLPLSPTLVAMLPFGALCPTTRGTGFKSAASFGMWFNRAIRASGLPARCTAHGLRKARCRQLAEAGCSALEVASISGHATLTEVQRYCAAVDQQRLARAALQRLAG